MKLPFTKKQPAAASIAQEIGALEARREMLQTKHSGAEQAREIACDDRRRHLIDGDENDANASRVIEERVAQSERDVVAFRDALAEISARLDDAHQRLAAAQDADIREARAREREHAAKEIADKTKAMETAIDNLAVAFSALVAVIPDDTGLMLETDNFAQPARAADVARAILAAGLYVTSPDAFQVIQPRTRSPRPAAVERVLNVLIHNSGTLSRFHPGLLGEECEVEPASITAEAIVVSRLREEARRLRAEPDLIQEAVE